MTRWWFLFSWCFLGALTAPSLFGQQPAEATTTPAATPAAGAPQDARQPTMPVAPQTPAAAAEAQEIQQVHHQPPGVAEPQAVEATKAGEAGTDENEGSEDPGVDERGEALLLEERISAPAARASTEARSATRQSALARQTASVQRQLGRAQGGGRSAAGSGTSDFFVSSWFTAGGGNEASPLTSAAASAAKYDAPAECEPLDRAIAEAFMRDSATREGVSLDLVREVIRQESGFQPCVVSAKGAIGMMQLMPETASSLGVLDPYDPRQNIDGGVKLLKRLLDKYQGRPDLALAAYNAGEGAVDRNNKVPDYEETRDYVRAIMRRVFEAPPEKQAKTRAPRIAAPARIPSPRAAFAEVPTTVSPATDSPNRTSIPNATP